MWLSIGYLIPQKGDYSGGAAPLPSHFFVMAENGTTTELLGEDGTSLMIQEATP